MYIDKSKNFVENVKIACPLTLYNTINCLLKYWFNLAVFPIFDWDIIGVPWLMEMVRGLNFNIIQELLSTVFECFYYTIGTWFYRIELLTSPKVIALTFVVGLGFHNFPVSIVRFRKIIYLCLLI